MLSERHTQVLNFSTRSVTTCFYNAVEHVESPEGLGRELSIDTTADVQVNYSKFKQLLVEKERCLREAWF